MALDCKCANMISADVVAAVHALHPTYCTAVIIHDSLAKHHELLRIQVGIYYKFRLLQKDYFVAEKSCFRFDEQALLRPLTFQSSRDLSLSLDHQVFHDQGTC
jgi:hypothetical protein